MMGIMTKKTKISTTTKNQALVDDDRWKKKGHAHLVRRPIPEVCSTCQGIGTVVDINGDTMECPICNGLGEIND